MRPDALAHHPRDIMVCPRCGMDMICHAEKPVEPTSPEEAENEGPIGIIVVQVHLCVNCGNIASRRTLD
jgi:predicted RNA-binding Zn-ribbon protein involved in translation (DUF1610 family)